MAIGEREDDQGNGAYIWVYVTIQKGKGDA